MIATAFCSARHSVTFALLLISISLVPSLAVAQSPQPAPLACAAPTATAFDVASVKPSDRLSGSSSMRGRPDSLTAGGTIFRMIEYAYDLHDFQVSGGPGWLNTATWEIVAKTDQPPANYDSLPNDARGAIQRQRMQAVLVQRFAFKCHFETRQLPVYNLVLAKSGSKLAPTPADAKVKGSLDENGRNRTNRWEAKGVAMDIVAEVLSQSLGRTVIDKTGLTALYDFTLTYTSDPDTNSPAATDDAVSGPTIFTALEEQLGLHLESAKGPVPVLVIDHIDKPLEN